MASAILSTIKAIFVGDEGGSAEDHDPFAYHSKIPLKNGYSEEEEQEEDEEEDEEEEEVRSCWETEKEFAEYVYGEARNFSKRPEEEPLEPQDFYFNMVSTVERDRATRKPVKVWWLPRDHPYVEMIVEENMQYLHEYQQFRFPHFGSYLSMVLYMDYAIQEAIKSCIIICHNNQLHVVTPPPPPQPEAAEEEEAPSPPPPPLAAAVVTQEVPMIRMDNSHNNNNNKKDD